jgi:hypothetical protein
LSSERHCSPNKTGMLNWLDNQRAIPTRENTEEQIAKWDCS